MPAVLVGIGLACFVIAPMAQTCVTDFDYRACETAGTVVLNLVGLAFVGIGGAWLYRNLLRIGPR